MRDIAYYPGCTHFETARHLEDSARAVLQELGYRLREMPDWECCGTVHGLADDDLVHQVAPVRNLARAEAAGNDRLLTLCAMCYNTLSQANRLVRNDAEKLRTLNEFMDEEPDYRGNVKVIHVLQLLRDEIGFEAIKDRVEVPMNGLRISPYYGCLLLRPDTVSIDNPERPSILSDLVTAMGAEPVADPRATHCCGSYHTVYRKDAVMERVEEIVISMEKRGGEIIALSCPLCGFNIDFRQDLVERKLPTVYFTQLLALAMAKAESCHFNMNQVDPRPLLREKGLLR